MIPSGGFQKPTGPPLEVHQTGGSRVMAGRLNGAGHGFCTTGGVSNPTVSQTRTGDRYAPR